MEARADQPSRQHSASTLLAASAMYLTNAGSTMGRLGLSSGGDNTRQQPGAGVSAIKDIPRLVKSIQGGLRMKAVA